MDVVIPVQIKTTLYKRLYCGFMGRRHHVKDCCDCACATGPVRELENHEFVVACPY